MNIKCYSSCFLLDFNLKQPYKKIIVENTNNNLFFNFKKGARRVVNSNKYYGKRRTN